LPEPGHLADEVGRAIDDVVECDPSAGAYQRCIELEIACHRFVRVPSIDEEEIDGVVAEERLHRVTRLRCARVDTPRVDVLPAVRERPVQAPPGGGSSRMSRDSSRAFGALAHAKR
jgi:hypothetical protein